MRDEEIDGGGEKIEGEEKDVFERGEEKGVTGGMLDVQKRYRRDVEGRDEKVWR